MRRLQSKEMSKHLADIDCDKKIAANVYTRGGYFLGLQRCVKGKRKITCRDISAQRVLFEFFKRKPLYFKKKAAD